MERPKVSLAWLWLPLCALAALTWPVWWGGESYFLRDAWTNFVPHRALQRLSWLEDGRFLLWNRWIGGGLPAAAEPNGSVFYPLSWPFLLPRDQAWGFSLMVDAHVALAAWGTFLLARRRLGGAGASAAASAFALSGLALSNRVNGQWLLALAWVPFFFHFLARALERRAWRLNDCVPLAGVWALQLLAGDPQVVYLEGLAAGLAVLTQAEAPNFRARLRGVGWLAAATALSVLWALPQLLPMADVLPRVERLGSSEGAWAWNPLRAWEWLLPFPWGEPFPVSKFWGKNLTDAQHSGFYFLSLYAGALTLPALWLGRKGIRRRDGWWVAGAAFLVLASMGPLLPLHGLLEWLPGWKVFRYPERLWVLPALAAALGVGLGVDALATAPRRALLLAVGTGMALAALPWAVPQLLGAQAGEAVQVDTVRRASLHALVALVAAGTAAALPARWRALGWALLIPLEHIVALRPLEATWAPPQVLAVNSGGRRLVILGDLQEATNRMFPDAAARRRFEAAVVRPNLGVFTRQEATNAVSSLNLRRTQAAQKVLGQIRAARLLGTSEIIARDGLTLPPYAPAESLGEGLRRYALANPEPLASAVFRADLAASADDALQRVKLNRHAFEESTPLASSDSPELACALTWNSADSFTVVCPKAALERVVRVVENFEPGWTTTSSAGEAPAFPVDGTLLGAKLPPNEDAVHFTYAPAWRRWAAWGHLTGWALAALLVWRRKQS